MESSQDSFDPISQALDHLERAYYFRSLNRLRNALTECQEAIRLAPDLPDAHLLRGILLESLGRKGEAREAFRDAARLDPALRQTRPDVFAEEPTVPPPGAMPLTPLPERRLARAREFLDRARDFAAQNEFRAALVECDRAVRLAPQLAEAHEQRGSILEALGRKGEARQAFREAARRASAARDIYRMPPGGVQPPAETRAQRERAAGERPHDPLYHLEQAYQLRREGAFESALAECDQVIRLAPDLSEARYLRSLLLQSLGREQEAAEAFRQAARLDPALEQVRPELFLDEDEALDLEAALQEMEARFAEILERLDADSAAAMDRVLGAEPERPELEPKEGEVEEEAPELETPPAEPPRITPEEEMPPAEEEPAGPVAAPAAELEPVHAAATGPQEVAMRVEERWPGWRVGRGGVLALVPGRIPLTAPLLVGYLLAVLGAELTVAEVDAALGLVGHFAILGCLVVVSASVEGYSARAVCLALGLVPLMRIIDLGMPLEEFTFAYRELIVSVPILAGVISVARNIGLSVAVIGLTGGRLSQEFGVGIVGIPLGVLSWLILDTEPIIVGLTWQKAIVPALILIVVGFVAELVFRGVMQRSAGSIGKWGWVYVAALYAAFQVEYLSALYCVFSFGVGLLFGWWVRRGGSILGVSFAHGLMSTCVFVVLPSVL